MPDGILAEHIKRRNKPRISPFELPLTTESDYCPLLIFKTPTDQQPLEEDNYIWLLSFLMDNGYTINYEMTNMINKSGYNNHNKNKKSRILCFFS
jgi:hypothetical protein